MINRGVSGSAGGRANTVIRSSHHQPAHEVGEWDAKVRAGCVPHPQAPVDHLGIEEQIPGGERQRTDHDKSQSRAPAGQSLRHGPRGRQHHEPGQRDQQRYADQLRLQHLGIVVGAERQPRL